jgi:predicted O-linked N-acetylglucosamine transferase (SPINDLY family)
MPAEARGRLRRDGAEVAGLTIDAPASTRHRDGSALSGVAQCFQPGSASVVLTDDDPEALAVRADALVRTDPSAALDLYRAAFGRAPHRIGWSLAIAKLALELGRVDQAIEAAERVLQAHPGQAEASVLLASALLRRRDFTRMAEILVAAPKGGAQAGNLANLTGTMLVQQGRIAEGLAAMRPIKRLAPRSATLQMSRVMYLNYDPDLSRAELLREHRWCGDAFADPVASVSSPAAGPRDPHRRLRIGYLSPDLRTHSVAYFVAPIFGAFDRDKFETIAYAHVARPDNVTAHLRGLATAWRDVTPLDDADLARLIRDDRIDILVDLAGFTKDSRLLACTARPAPIQISYLGYPNTTGLPQIDYRITDHIADPDDADDFHTETLIRLPRCFLAFAAPDHAPEVEPPPVLRKGYVTFGSFNSLAKVNRRVIALWAEVLRAVPDSRLLLKAFGSGDPTAQGRLHSAFAAAGIDPGRIEFASYAASAHAHLEVYREVDVALDTFPYNGTTTTCEALWMGVPVVTLAGERHAARVGASLLGAAGFSAGIAERAEGYVTIARLLAEQTQLLVALRGNLRAEMARSPLCDAAGHARALEEAYRAVWQIWCEAA